MEKEIAAKLYYLENIRLDPVLGILNIISMLKGAEVQKVMAHYEDMKSGKLNVAQVISSMELSHEEREKLLKFLTSNFSDEVVVIFETDEKVLDGLQIKVGKNIVTLS